MLGIFLSWYNQSQDDIPTSESSRWPLQKESGSFGGIFQRGGAYASQSGGGDPVLHRTWR